MFTITYPESASPPAPRKRGRELWAIADQALISATNCLTMVLVARGVGGPAEFGTFTLVYSALLFANMFQTALVTQPHNVLGSSRHDDDYAAYTTSTLIAQILLAAFEGAIALAIAEIGRETGWAAAPLLFALVPAIITWQLQEFARRVLYTEARHAAAFFNDLISYGGQTLLIGLLWFLDWHNQTTRGAGYLTGTSALYALAATSLPAAALGLWQIRHSLSGKFRLSALPENWRFGKWLAGAELLNWCSSIQMYLYLAAAVLGTAVTGDLKAAQVLFGPMRVLAFYLDTVLPIRFARARARGGDEAIKIGLRHVLARVALPLAGCCAVIAVLAGPLMKLTFGATFGGAEAVLALYSAYSFLSYVQMMIAAALRAKQTTHSIFLGSVFGVVVALLTSWPLISYFGTEGIMLSMILAAVAVTLVYYYALRHHMTAPLAQDAGVLTAAGNEEASCPS